MIEQIQILQAGRAAGKTYSIMTEIHDLIVAGRRSEVLAVLPQSQYVHWWSREWERRFTLMPFPQYVTISTVDRVRGLRLAKIFIEDIDTITDGIYNKRLETIWPSLYGADDPEVTATSNGPNGWPLQY